MNSTPHVMAPPDKMVWSEERNKWLCFDDGLIDEIVHSKDFVVPTYDYAELETKFSKNFEFTKQVISHFPLANEGEAHLLLRKRMATAVNANLKQAIQVFAERLEAKISDLSTTPGTLDIAGPLTEAILESNLVLADVHLEENLDYSDLTRMLDDSQSIKSRLAREELIQSICPKLDEEDRFFKLALISVGVNALISSTLHSVIKVLSNEGFEALVNRKYFFSNGIKHLERVAVQKTTVGGKGIQPGDKLRLYVEAYERADMTELQRNKKFFAAESAHACIGMSYSMSVWKETVRIMASQFKNARLIHFDYRSKDGIFHFPTHVVLEYSK